MEISVADGRTFLLANAEGKKRDLRIVSITDLDFSCVLSYIYKIHWDENDEAFFIIYDEKNYHSILFEITGKFTLKIDFKNLEELKRELECLKDDLHSKDRKSLTVDIQLVDSTYVVAHEYKKRLNGY